MTFDRDIGGIVLLDGRPHPGVIYLRLRGGGAALWRSFQEIWPLVEPLAANRFITVRHNQIVVRELPSGS